MASTAGAPRDPDETVGSVLARMRRARNLTGGQLAKLVGMSQPKISRLENGVGHVDPDDVAAIARALGASGDQIDHLVAQAELSHNRMTDWRPSSTSLAHRQRLVGAIEADAQTLRIFQPVAIPGLLQTSEYARAILTPFQDLMPASATDSPATAVAEAVSLRIKRQEQLVDPTRRFHFIMTESVLSNEICALEHMPAQIRRLVDVARQDNVTLGVIPARSEWTIPPLHGFVLADESRVEIDLINTVISSEGKADAAFYRHVFDAYAKQTVKDVFELLERHRRRFLGKLQDQR
ncbi:helix-turn-helix protein [Asanoa ferruginea]|uniref:Helix-turn-helix protein n=1 Tax=Asanoa ferruginea TaxID=53367 RepID=A0A3D9ZR31_9ACTN|nr:helix-turn-helix transcriptional regulator [Asanoa ferruginea]REF99848.1 helix-turn-helix protein [Asanoa ferruginea]GIF52671.1 transcriptional regulator [Asanoa ferruginea]